MMRFTTWVKTHLEVLVRHCSSVSDDDVWGQPLLFWIVQNDDVRVMREYLRDQPDMVNRTSMSQSVLHYAVRLGFLPSVSVLLEYGADVNARRTFDITPLHDAISTGRADVVKVLVEAGADVNATNAYGVTPLGHIPANFLSCWQMATVLVAAGARDWAAVPDVCPGLERAMALVMRDTPTDVAQLVHRLDPFAKRRALFLMWALRGKHLPAPICVHIVSMSMSM